MDSAGGEAGLDWANIGSPQTEQRLGCTSLFAVHSACNAVNAIPNYTEQGIACTVWNSVQANYDTCGTFGVLLDCRTGAAVQPTVPDRRLDVTATGAAGIDWGNVENKTTANDLTCTLVFSITSVSNSVNIGSCGTVYLVQTLSETAQNSIVDEVVAEPSGVFAWPATFRTVMQWLGALSSNCVRQTVSLQTLRNRADASSLATAPITCEPATVHRGSFT